MQELDRLYFNKHAIDPENDFDIIDISSNDWLSEMDDDDPVLVEQNEKGCR